MNYTGFDFDKETIGFLNSVERGNKLPHAVMIESADEEKADSLATFLAMYAVCGADDKPCGVCKNCLNAGEKRHPDISYPKVKTKSKTYDVEQMREIIKDAYILPNDSSAKVYIFEKADERFTPLVQNTFLKLFEEPPQNVYFILLCKSTRSFLDTILSRFTAVRIRAEEKLNTDSLADAENIVSCLLENREYPLLKSLNALSDKDRYGDIIAALRLHFRDALVFLSGGETLGSEEIAKKLASRITRKKLLEMLELCDSFDNKMKFNVNINLLTTWMCGEFRRILWQR